MEGREGCMISANDELTGQQVLAELFKSIHYCQKLFPSCAIFEFRRTQTTTGVCDDA